MFGFDVDLSSAACDVQAYIIVAEREEEIVHQATEEIATSIVIPFKNSNGNGTRHGLTPCTAVVVKNPWIPAPRFYNSRALASIFLWGHRASLGMLLFQVRPEEFPQVVSFTLVR
jgi:hypothetical protein